MNAQDYKAYSRDGRCNNRLELAILFELARLLTPK